MSLGMGVFFGGLASGTLLRPFVWPFSLQELAWSIMAHLRIQGEALSGRDLFSLNKSIRGQCKTRDGSCSSATGR